MTVTRRPHNKIVFKGVESIARRHKDSLADALVDTTARLPWWVGVALALAAYLWLHGLAAKPVGPLTQSAQAGQFAVSALWQTLAAIGQYVLPALFLLGAGISAFKRSKARQLHADVANRADRLSQMSWREFELMVGEYFRRQGFRVMDKGGAGPDGGVDVLLQRGADTYLVQCKQWRALRVGIEPVRELYGVMAARRVAGGFVVTSGDFTEAARNFAQGREIELINGKEFQRGVQAQAVVAATPAQPGAARPLTASAVQRNPDCPLCFAPMVMRQTRTGTMPEKKFWGCSRFAKTKCHGTRELG